MRQRRHYALAFLLVLLAAATGAGLGLSLVQPLEVPQLDVVASLQQAVAGVDVNALIPRRNPAGGLSEQPVAATTALPPAPTVTVLPPDLPTPPVAVTGTVPADSGITPVPSVETPASEDAPAAGLATTPAPTATAPAASTTFAFLPAGALRHSSDDCPGASIRGTVRNASGEPLPGVRLWRYDQFGNEQTIETKSGPADLGQYDFVLGDTPNVHYVQVLDASGSPISPRLEVQHRQGDAADAACHWIDWIRQ